LPTGTVTFLFTDVEGSTELVASLGDRYAALVERHSALLRDEFARHHGVEVSTEGDSFFVVFSSAADAVASAVAAQRALSVEPWPGGSAVRVRMGAHTGAGVKGGDSYVGLDVHRAARIASAAHGGQIVVSEATRSLVEPTSSASTRFQDLGWHRLKGLGRPERIYQVEADGIPSEFPPLRSLNARPNNLPVNLATFVGRAKQLDEIGRVLESTRLLTLTGPGGTGKSRLAVRAAEEFINDYEHGCWFVSLGTLRDPELVPPTIAAALGVSITGDRSVMNALASWLASRRLLLVLDNFEQVSDAAPYVAELLGGAPGLRVIVTSRAPLHVYGERQYPVPPLDTSGPPAQATGLAVGQLSRIEAVQLLVERAKAVRPEFRLTETNASAVAGLVVRLDGLPLAIELAAARIALLTPAEMLARLHEGLAVLADSSGALPERQRTMLAVIEWSYNLLAPAERELFARLSIFRGSFALEAAERICEEGGHGRLLDGVASLVDKSLLRSEAVGNETRFSMLETVRDYARERLLETGEFGLLVARHASYFLGMAIEAEPHLSGPDQVNWVERLEREHDNIRAALGRDLPQDALDQSLYAAGALWRFWQLRGHFAVARQVFDRVLGQPSGSLQSRAKAHSGAGGIDYWRGEYGSMAHHYRKARELYETVGEPALLAEAFYNESFVPVLLEGDIEAGRRLLGRSLELYQQSGDALGAAKVEATLGFSYSMQGQLEEAISRQEGAVAIYRSAHATWQLSESLFILGQLYAHAGSWPRAVGALRESLALTRKLDIALGYATTFETMGAVAIWGGDPEMGSRLLGKADEMKERLGAAAPGQMIQTEVQRERARVALGTARYDELREEGARLSVRQAAGLADQVEPSPDTLPMPFDR
jgi:predicted ATPase/class 3 adenylate cyclase